VRGDLCGNLALLINERRVTGIKVSPSHVVETFWAEHDAVKAALTRQAEQEMSETFGKSK
jgi:hypothetical protein